MSSLHSNLFMEMAGAPLVRQPSSQSFIPRPSLSEYTTHLRSFREAAFLELRRGASRVWERKWVVFEDGELRYSPEPLSSQNEIVMVSLSDVRLLRSNNNPAEPTILMKTTSDDIHLRFPDAEVMKKWLFNFQKSVAQVLVRILEARNQALNTVGRWDECSAQLEPVYGHGNYSNAARRHSGTTLALGAAAATAMSAQAALESDASVFDLQNWRSDLPMQGTFSPLKSGAIAMPSNAAPVALHTARLGVSPAIPIGSHFSQYRTEEEESDDGEYRGRVASSYRDEDKGLSPMANFLHRDTDYDDEEDDEEPDHITVSTQEPDNDYDDDDGVFEMDDYGRTPNRSRANSQHKVPLKGSPHSNLSSPRGSLSKPRRSLTSRPSLLRWRGGHCSKQGQRSKNEDRFVVAPNIHDSSYAAEEAKLRRNRTLSTNGGNSGASSYSGSRSLLSPVASVSTEATKHQHGGGHEKCIGFFAVYDGHAGDAAAIFLEQQLLDRVYRHTEFHSNLEKAITDTCISIDKEFLAWCKANNKYAGTTALGAFVSPTHFTIFSIGDSMAVLSSGGRASVVNDLHKPDRIDEQLRISRANGWILEEKVMNLWRLHHMDYSDPLALERAKSTNWVTTYRVVGELAVSRSIGDPDYKGFTPGAKVDAFFTWPEGHSQVFHADLVIPDPECRVHQITPEDDFLILATDGVWDVVSPEEAVKEVSQLLARGKSPSDAAEELCNMALRLGSEDNVTVVITQFLHS